MNLTVADLAALPLAAALQEADGNLVARTPEWVGGGPGCIAYPVRSKRLLVATLALPSLADDLVGLLLRHLEAATASSAGEQALRLRLLGAAARLLGGRDLPGGGSAADVLHLASAGIRARTALRVEARPASAKVRHPELAALVLVQLAANAERHDGAEAVLLEHDGRSFHVSWPSSGAGAAVSTSRRHRDRSRWGLGFARIAADTLGATVYPPAARPGGRLAATLELGIARLALPLALVRGGVVVRASHAWDEETGLLPGASATRSDRLGEVLRLAGERPGSITRRDGWTARARGDSAWVAVPPDDGLDRARDLLAGLAHERALLAGVDGALQVRLRATALLLGALLGAPLPRVPARAWQESMAALLPLLGCRQPVPSLAAIGGVAPEVAAVLAADLGERFESDGERLWLRLAPAGRDHPLSRAVAPSGATRVALA